MRATLERYSEYFGNESIYGPADTLDRLQFLHSEIGLPGEGQVVRYVKGRSGLASAFPRSSEHPRPLVSLGDDFRGVDQASWPYLLTHEGGHSILGLDDTILPTDYAERLAIGRRGSVGPYKAYGQGAARQLVLDENYSPQLNNDNYMCYIFGGACGP